MMQQGCGSECSHHEQLCTCEANTPENIVKVVTNLLAMIMAPQWELSYTSLDQPGPHRLCVVGKCRRCGGRLCYGIKVEDSLTGDRLLDAMYQGLKVFHSSNDRLSLGRDLFDARFLAMFHVQDMMTVRNWLKARQTPTLYTILKTSVDADRGLFPDPSAEGSYLSIEKAREKMAELVELEEVSLDSRYDRVNREDDVWEAYQDGYAAACCSRIEIVTSTLMDAPKEADGWKK